MKYLFVLLFASVVLETSAQESKTCSILECILNDSSIINVLEKEQISLLSPIIIKDKCETYLFQNGIVSEIEVNNNFKDAELIRVKKIKNNKGKAKIVLKNSKISINITSVQAPSSIPWVIDSRFIHRVSFKRHKNILYWSNVA